MPCGSPQPFGGDYIIPSECSPSSPSRGIRKAAGAGERTRDREKTRNRRGDETIMKEGVTHYSRFGLEDPTRTRSGTCYFHEVKQLMSNPQFLRLLS